jgi:hypothetical protein
LFLSSSQSTISLQLLLSYASRNETSIFVASYGSCSVRSPDPGFPPHRVITPPGQCSSGFWPGLVPNHTELPAKNETADRLPVPFAYTNCSQRATAVKGPLQRKTQQEVNSPSQKERDRALVAKAGGKQPKA